MTLESAVRKVAAVVGRSPLFFRAPLVFHRALARLCELTMRVPLLAVAQARILSEGVVEPALAPDRLPSDLLPVTRFTTAQIQVGLPCPAPFTHRDLRLCRR